MATTAADAPALADLEALESSGLTSGKAALFRNRFLDLIAGVGAAEKRSAAAAARRVDLETARRLEAPSANADSAAADVAARLESLEAERMQVRRSVWFLLAPLVSLSQLSIHGGSLPACRHRRRNAGILHCIH
jgi:hypothetical protein